MLAVPSNIPKSLPHGAYLNVCDNSGAKLLKVVSVFGQKTVKGRYPAAGIGDKIMASVKKGKPEMRKQVVFAVIVRQKKEFKRADGTRVKFEDNAAVVLKDEKGNPKGTLIKGPVAKEIIKRWPAIAKITSVIV
ncbi:50S ribosomal protein L14 [Candidatus Woesearchaeota archaeon]|nr:50S ribosomal protein L14 [Candidatus Woesearchaeota archaeon]